MTSEKFKAILKRVVYWGRKCLAFLANVVVTILLMLFPLAWLQEAVTKHRALLVPLIVSFIVGIGLAVHQYRQRELDTQQGIQAFAVILWLTILVFSVLSLILFKFGLARYQAFCTESLNNDWSTTFRFVQFYTWQLFDIVPALKINEALGWNRPLEKSGFLSGLLTLGFRSTVILVLLKQFSRWWNSRVTKEDRPAKIIFSARFRASGRRRFGHADLKRKLARSAHSKRSRIIR